MQQQEKRPRTALWVALGLALTVATVLTLGVVRVDGAPIIAEPGQVLVQIIASAGVVAAALVPTLRRASRDAADAATHAAVTKEQTTNAHKTNMREELTEYHEETIQLFKRALGDIEHVASMQREQGERIAGIQSDQRGIRRDIGRNMDMTLGVSNRVTQLGDRLASAEKDAANWEHPAILRLLAAHAASNIETKGGDNDG